MLGILFIFDEILFIITEYNFASAYFKKEPLDISVIRNINTDMTYKKLQTFYC